MLTRQRSRQASTGGPAGCLWGGAGAGVPGRAAVFRTEGTAWAELERLGGQDPGWRACFRRGAVAVRLAGGVRPRCGGLEGPGSWGGVLDLGWKGTSAASDLPALAPAGGGRHHRGEVLPQGLGKASARPPHPTESARRAVAPPPHSRCRGPGASLAHVFADKTELVILPSHHQGILLRMQRCGSVTQGRSGKEIELSKGWAGGGRGPLQTEGPACREPPGPRLEPGHSACRGCWWDRPRVTCVWPR